MGNVMKLQRQSRAATNFSLIGGGEEGGMVLRFKVGQGRGLSCFVGKKVGQRTVRQKQSECYAEEEWQTQRKQLALFQPLELHISVILTIFFFSDSFVFQYVNDIIYKWYNFLVSNITQP